MSERSWRWGLGLVVFLVGMLISNGRFHSVDESAMFVAATNLVRDGWPHTNQMGYSLWSLRPGEEVTMLSPDGDLFTKKSPLMIVLLAPLVALGQAIPAVGGRQMALLLGPLLTAATAVLLYTLARQLDYRRATATLAALIYTFATMALPYSQTVFGELAAAFGLLLALLGVIGARQPVANGKAPSRLAFGSGLGVALAMGVNALHTAVAGLFGLTWLLIGRRWPAQRDWWRIMVAFSLPIALLGSGLLVYNAVRFGGPLSTGYRFAPGQEGFTTPLWWGLAGLLFSPARGLVWFSPPVLLAILGGGRFYRRERPLTWLMLAVIGVQGVAFSLWWEWWGGYGWGPRFLLPIVPYLMLFSLPLLDLVGRGHRWAQTAVGLLVGLGIVVQIGGTAVDANVYEQWLAAHFPAPANQPLRYHHDPTLVYNVARSPIVAHWQAMVAGKSQPFWWQVDDAPRLATIPNIIRSAQQPGDVLVFLEPTLLNDIVAAEDLPSAFGLPTNIAATEPLAQTLWKIALEDATGVWLITWYAPGDAANWYERDLRQTWASQSEEWADGLRLLHFARPPQGPEDGRTTAVHIPFQNIHLIGYRLTTHENTLFVELDWVAESPIAEDYVNFVQILAADGRVVAQQDRPPLGGYRPTSSWAMMETITDRFAFSLDSNGLAEARIIVGWYSWPTLERLPTTLTNGATADFYELQRGQ
jgi:hypothetical protein